MHAIIIERVMVRRLEVLRPRRLRRLRLVMVLFGIVRRERRQQPCGVWRKLLR